MGHTVLGTTVILVAELEVMLVLTLAMVKALATPILCLGLGLSDALDWPMALVQ